MDVVVVAELQAASSDKPDFMMVAPKNYKIQLQQL